MSLFNKSTHNNDDTPCKDCGATAQEKLDYICPGPAPEEGTFTKAYLDEHKERQRLIYCTCGGSIMREPSHTHYCPARRNI